MSTSHKRMTFTIIQDMMPVMDRAKRKFYNYTQSDMIRILITAGLNSYDTNCRKSGQQKKKMIRSESC